MLSLFVYCENEGLPCCSIDLVDVVGFPRFLCSSISIAFDFNKTWPKRCCCHCSLVGLFQFLGCLEVILSFYFNSFTVFIFISSILIHLLIDLLLNYLYYSCFVSANNSFHYVFFIDSCCLYSFWFLNVWNVVAIVLNILKSPSVSKLSNGID
jgi:hypothetical protein